MVSLSLNRISKILIWSSVVFFAAGGVWGFWTHKKHLFSRGEAGPLRVLCAENWLSDEVLQAFAKKRGISIQQWTYSNPNEFIRQMANADGNIDVICTSSLLLKGLVQSRWIKKLPYTSLENAKNIAVDFMHLPYDPESEYSVPIYWNLYGFFGKGNAKAQSSWKQVLQSHKVALFGDELNVLHLLSRNGIKIEERLQDSETKSLENEIRKFIRSLVQIEKPSTTAISAEAITAKAEWIQLPLSQVSRLLGEPSPYQFWLPSDGGMVEVGLFAVGEHSERVPLALELINHLISTDQALEMHKRLGAGVVHTSLNHLNSIAPLQKAEALRRFPLTKYEFPEVSMDAIPRFQKFFNETKSQ